jgi:hypothetical protein
MTTENYVFGGYTSGPGASVGGNTPDDSLETFLFSLKTLSNIPAKKFPLKQESHAFAVCCDPSFVGGRGGRVSISSFFLGVISTQIMSRISDIPPKTRQDMMESNECISRLFISHVQYDMHWKESLVV